MTAIIETTGSDASAVEQASKTVVAGGQICVHGRPHNATHEWAE